VAVDRAGGGGGLPDNKWGQSQIFLGADPKLRLGSGPLKI
jgi:hypothetical protein